MLIEKSLPHLRKVLLLLSLLWYGLFLWAEMPTDLNTYKVIMNGYFSKYYQEKFDFSAPIEVKSITLDVKGRLLVEFHNAPDLQNITPKQLHKLYKSIKKLLPTFTQHYQLELQCGGQPIAYFLPDAKLPADIGCQFWGDIDYVNAPWVANASRPFAIPHGLFGRHIALWASHGRYYDVNKSKWVWQRPALFCTTEDLFTQTIVVPYLIPMLQRAGAVVFTPRERDWQTEEHIIDNDISKVPAYQEKNIKGEWTTTATPGFSMHQGSYENGENPFEQGTARMTKATRSKSPSLISYQPTFLKAGRFAVYVSYQTVEKSVSDAEYIVYHRGLATRFLVNQTMGGGTWVYLGTFDFDAGSSLDNRVVLTNHSAHHGVVTADAVRFGGGMGNISRGGIVSGMPRCLEGARYYAQWAGAPTWVYNGKLGANDYGDDINARPLMTNWLSGGSCYVPNLDGKRVPIELALAVHSDAGYNTDGSLVGSLAICTTHFNEGQLNAGVSRLVSKDFAQQLLDGLQRDLSASQTPWPIRYLWDKNYAETRLSEVPSAIIETLSHQNFPDMLLGQDPHFKFLMARSLYKTIARYVNGAHGRPTVIAPLAPQDFRLTFVQPQRIRLAWSATPDSLEPSAMPSSYVVYTAMGDKGYDNGVVVGTPYTEIDLQPGVQYNFKVTAINQGGESFPTEELSAYYALGATKTILVANGFTRLAPPFVVDDGDQQGFDIDKDPGVSYGLTAGWSGRQLNFDKARMGIEDATGLGYSGNELEGKFIAGNDFSAVRSHVEALAAIGTYNVASCALSCVEKRQESLARYQAIDILLGLQKTDSYGQTFSKSLQQLLRDYVVQHGQLLVSGSYAASDQRNESDRKFLSDVFKVESVSCDSCHAGETIYAVRDSFDIYRTPNADHYAATSVDALQPLDGAATMLQYSDGQPAATCYRGSNYRAWFMGFPFECIRQRSQRTMLMRTIMQQLFQ